MESELFGYERGAFTGANQRRKGLFEAAHNGTIFLDEIAEISTASQVKLLRVLQEGALRPVGAHAEIQIDVRVIAATNRNLAREVAAGRFREDLFYRIAVLAITTPPLRDRTSDIPLLMQYFQHQTEQKIKSTVSRRIEDDAIDALFDYPWPGNVRQLRHVVEKLVVGTLGYSLTQTRFAAHSTTILTLSCAQQMVAGHSPPTPRVIPWMIFLTMPCWIFMTCCGERRAAIPKLPANCELTALHFINAWSVLVEGSIFRLSKRPWQALFRLLGCLVAQG